MSTITTTLYNSPIDDTFTVSQDPSDLCYCVWHGDSFICARHSYQVAVLLCNQHAQARQ